MATARILRVKAYPSRLLQSYRVLTRESFCCDKIIPEVIAFLLLQKIEVPPEVWNDGVVEVERGEKGHQTRHPPQTVVGPRTPSLRKHDWRFFTFSSAFSFCNWSWSLPWPEYFVFQKFQNYFLNRDWDMRNCRKVAVTSNSSKSTVQVYTLS